MYFKAENTTTILLIIKVIVFDLLKSYKQNNEHY